MEIKNLIEQWRRQLGGALKTPRGKDVVTYLVFVCVAFVFWLLLSLDTEVQRDYDIPFQITEIPDSVTMISTPPTTINVGVQAKGSQLLRFNWGRIAPLKINFREFVDDENNWSVSSVKLESKMREYFGNSVLINSIRPDSLKLIYTSIPGEKVPLEIDIDVNPNLQYIISGDITTNIDSVMVYSPEGRSIPSKVVTEKVVRRNLKDTTTVEVKFKHVAGVRFIPDRVSVKIPVEPLIAKRQVVRIHPENLPNKRDVITFPSRVEVSYLVPMSRYNDEDDHIQAFVDFNDIATSRHKAAVHLSLLPPYISNVSIVPDSVEYVIENND